MGQFGIGIGPLLELVQAIDGPSSGKGHSESIWRGSLNLAENILPVYKIFVLHPHAPPIKSDISDFSPKYHRNCYGGYETCRNARDIGVGRDLLVVWLAQK